LGISEFKWKLAERRVKYTNILVGTDGTALMDTAFNECAYLARLMGATIHVAYVLDVAGFGAQPIDATWEERYVIIKSQARQILSSAREALVKRGVAEASITEILLEGHPTEEISAYSKITKLISLSLERTAEKVTGKTRLLKLVHTPEVSNMIDAQG
jgi:nucleotide-binding universal stress UspA family protein